VRGLEGGGSRGTCTAPLARAVELARAVSARPVAWCWAGLQVCWADDGVRVCGGADEQPLQRDSPTATTRNKDAPRVAELTLDLAAMERELGLTRAWGRRAW
jgi:hypothetical protein